MEIFVEGDVKNLESFLSQIKPKNTKITMAEVSEIKVAIENSENFRPSWKIYGEKFVIDKKTKG